jgi:hypothetical protein
VNHHAQLYISGKNEVINVDLPIQEHGMPLNLSFLIVFNNLEFIFW